MVYVGTSGWAYPRWKPRFYPAELCGREFLAFYSRRLNAVEVNYTFCGRDVLRHSVAERWLAQTPREFVFAFRGPKPITHFRRHRMVYTDKRGATRTLGLPPDRAWPRAAQGRCR